MAKRTFICLDCKTECECSPVGIIPKRCKPCRAAFMVKDQAQQRAAKGGKKRRRKPARTGKRAPSNAGGEILELLDGRIREICQQHVVIGKDLVEGVVKEALDDCLTDLVDARIRAVFAGRAKA